MFPFTSTCTPYGSFNRGSVNALVKPITSNRAKFDPDGTVTVTPAAAGVTVTVPSGSNFARFDVIGLTSAFTDPRLNDPYGVHVDVNGNIYVADRSNYRIRQL